MRLFHLYRVEDLTGVSGTGPVVEGVEFTNGWCAMRWITQHSTLCFYQSIEDVRHIHGHGGRTELILHDFEPLRRMPDIDSGSFDLFLQTLENLSAAVNLLEEPGSTGAELHQIIEQAHEDLKRLEARIGRRLAAKQSPDK